MILQKRDTFTADGSANPSFTLSQTPISFSQTDLFVDGILQPLSSYSLSGQIVTLEFTPLAGTTIDLIYLASIAFATGGIDLTTVANVKRWIGAVVSSRWQTNFNYSRGQFIVDPANHTQRVITPGISAASIPTFNDNAGVTTEGPSTPPLQWQDEGQSDDQTIQDCITAFSLYALRISGRGNQDGSVPTDSPFVTPVSYSESYDGNGQRKLYVRNWPLSAVASLNVNGVSIAQSTSVMQPGWVIDGAARSIVLRGGASPSVARFSNRRGYGRDCGGYIFAEGLQNVQIQYTAGFSGVPSDLEMLARKIVALNYKRTGWIGQKSQAMANGAGTVTYGDWEMDTQDERALLYYRAFNY